MNRQRFIRALVRAIVTLVAALLGVASYDAVSVLDL